MSKLFRTMLANVGLATLPCGVPLSEYETIFVFSSMDPQPIILLIILMNGSHIISLRRLSRIILCGMLSKHLEISPWMTQAKSSPFSIRTSNAVLIDRLGLKPWLVSWNNGSQIVLKISSIAFWTIFSLGLLIFKVLIFPLALGMSWVLLGPNLYWSLAILFAVSRNHWLLIPSRVILLMSEPGVMLPGLPLIIS